jgi:hypothetical protein
VNPAIVQRPEESRYHPNTTPNTRKPHPPHQTHARDMAKRMRAAMALARIERMPDSLTLTLGSLYHMGLPPEPKPYRKTIPFTDP